jgi:hypothetical protein
MRHRFLSLVYFLLATAMASETDNRTKSTVKLKHWLHEDEVKKLAEREPHPSHVVIALPFDCPECKPQPWHFLTDIITGSTMMQIPISSGLPNNTLPNNTAYNIILKAIPNSHTNSQHVFAETFTRDDLMDGSFYLYLGTNILTPGMYKVEVTLNDEFYDTESHPDEALLNFHIILNVECCPKNQDSRIRRGRTTVDELRTHSDLSMIMHENAGHDDMKASFASVFPTSSAVVKPSEKMMSGNLDSVSSFPGYNWWYDPRQGNALHFYDLDLMYGSEYHGTDHVDQQVCARIRIPHTHTTYAYLMRTPHTHTSHAHRIRTPIRTPIRTRIPHTHISYLILRSWRHTPNMPSSTAPSYWGESVQT